MSLITESFGYLQLQQTSPVKQKLHMFWRKTGKTHHLSVFSRPPAVSWYSPSKSRRSVVNVDLFGPEHHAEWPWYPVIRPPRVHSCTLYGPLIYMLYDAYVKTKCMPCKGHVITQSITQWGWKSVIHMIVFLLFLVSLMKKEKIANFLVTQRSS